MKKILCIAVAAMSLTGCGYNEFQRLDEQVKSSWSEVLNQYQRRNDLLPNLIATVKAETEFEQATLLRVTEARSRVLGLQADAAAAGSAAGGAALDRAQTELGASVHRLLVLSEQYPNLKSNQAFHSLRVGLESTENRISVARTRYIQSVQAYNGLQRAFPSNLTAKALGYEIKPNFAVADEGRLATPPEVAGLIK